MKKKDYVIQHSGINYIAKYKKYANEIVLYDADKKIFFNLNKRLFSTGIGTIERVFSKYDVLKSENVTILPPYMDGYIESLIHGAIHIYEIHERFSTLQKEIKSREKEIKKHFTKIYN